jgi:hypothetical protein
MYMKTQISKVSALNVHVHSSIENNNKQNKQRNSLLQNYNYMPENDTIITQIFELQNIVAALYLYKY